MVWPILISVAVTPRISAADEMAGKVMSATAPSAAHPADRRINSSPTLFAASHEAAWPVFRLTANMPWGENCSQRLFARFGRCSRLSLLKGNDQLQAGPCVVDGADLDVDEPERQRGGANHILGDVGRDAGRFLRPRHPHHAAGRNRLAAGGKS